MKTKEQKEIEEHVKEALNKADETFFDTRFLLQDTMAVFLAILVSATVYHYGYKWESALHENDMVTVTSKLGTQILYSNQMTRAQARIWYDQRMHNESESAWATYLQKSNTKTNAIH